MKKIFVLIGAALSMFSASAQTYENPWSVGLYGVKTEYNGDFGNKFFDPTEKFYGGAGLSFSRYLSKYFDVTLYGFYGFHGAEDEFNDNKSFSEEFHANMVHVDLTAKYKILQEKYIFRPFVYLGPGFRSLAISGEDGGNTSIINGQRVRTGSYRCKDGSDFMITGGIGCDAALSEHWAIRYMCGYGYTFADDKDERECGDYNDQQLLHSLGVTYSFSTKPRDTDGDGVINKLDECPNNTPEEISKGVDEKGCPLDSDKDGVPDYKDECPGTPSGVQVDEKGCPIDTDKDGVADYLDKCNDTPEGVQVDANGCPLDSDGDGVADYLDKCPNTPAAAYGKIDANGCPIDTDGDGIADYEDVCPNEAGVKENNGCPEVKEAVKQLFKKALNGIQFETGKATIKKSSNKILDDVVKVMQENPSYKLFIGGHTDNTGKADKNLQLSEDRAAAVRKYLEDKGVESSRMKSKGFGQEKPVADNKTAKGRAENRRVEFRVVFEK